MRRLFVVLLVALLAVAALGAVSVAVSTDRSSAAQGDYGDDYGNDDHGGDKHDDHGDHDEDKNDDHGGHGADDATHRSETPAASPAASPAATPAAANRVEIDIVNFAFDPPSLTIPPGTTVVWTNTSPTAHTVYGDFAGSDILNTGDTFEFTFTDPGTYDYVCSLHPAMKASIVVDPNAPPVGG